MRYRNMALYAILKHHKYCFEKTYDSILDWYRNKLEQQWWDSLTPEEQECATKQEEKKTQRSNEIISYYIWQCSRYYGRTKIMEGLNPNSWYRIPGYNGYEYHINAREVRSWKNIRKYPNGYILSKKDSGKEGYVWELTNDYNKRERVTERMIADIFKTATYLSKNS